MGAAVGGAGSGLLPAQCPSQRTCLASARWTGQGVPVLLGERGSGGGRPAPGWRRCRGGQRFLALRAVHTFPWRSRRAPRPPCACVSHTFRAPGALGRQQAPLSSQQRQCLCARRDTRPSVPAVCGASVDRICPPPRPVGLPVCPGGFLGVSPVVNSKSPKCSLNDNHCSCSRV